jgi:hypothetical protein
MPIKVKNELGLVRDEYSKAIINTDAHGYASYIAARDKKLQEQQQLDDLTSEVAELKRLVASLIANK